MTNIMDKEKCVEIRNAMDKTLSKVCKDFNMAISIGNIKYTDNSFRCVIEGIETSMPGESKMDKPINLNKLKRIMDRCGIKEVCNGIYNRTNGEYHKIYTDKDNNLFFCYANRSIANTFLPLLKWIKSRIKIQKTNCKKVKIT